MLLLINEECRFNRIWKESDTPRCIKVSSIHQFWLKITRGCFLSVSFQTWKQWILQKLLCVRYNVKTRDILSCQPPKNVISRFVSSSRKNHFLPFVYFSFQNRECLCFYAAYISTHWGRVKQTLKKHDRKTFFSFVWISPQILHYWYKQMFLGL